MPQRKQVTWSELRVGLLALAGMAIILVGILYVTGVGILAPKYRVKTYLPEVEGLTIGAPVRLDGIEVGNVEALRMARREAGQPFVRGRSIELVMRINRDFQKEILTDSTARLVTEGLLGNRYVSIERGVTGTPIPEWGEVRGIEEAAIKQIVERGADLVQNLNVMTTRVREIVEAVEQGRGSLGKILTDETAYNRLNSALGGLQQVVADTQAGKGSLGKLVTSDELYQRSNSAAGRFDAVLADVQAQKGTLGKVIYDPAFYDNAKQFVERGNTVLADVQAGKGTLGKLATDDTLYLKWRETGTNLEAATARLNQNQGTAGRFFSDPQLYDNVAGLAGDMRLLIGEFRQNPKKFLRVKFSIF